MDNKKPKKVCQYGEKCYRKNPIHFSEYGHPHLDNIFNNCFDEIQQEYVIPDELSLTKHIILEQLQLLEKLFPRKKITNSNDSMECESISDNNNKKVESLIEKKTRSNSPLATSSRRNLSSEQQSKRLKPSQSPERAPGPSRRSPIPCSFDNQSIMRPVSTKTDSSKLSQKPKVTKNIKDYVPVVLPKGQMAKKLENAAPYNFFLTAITDSTATHEEPLSITLQEILDKSLGEIECSVQINFMIDIGWLLGHYYFAECLDKPLLVLYGDESPELLSISKLKPQVTTIKINMASPFATHHTKMMLFGYKDGSMRVVISTANLYEDDWHNRTQGIWMSPKLEPLPETADTGAGDSSTEFRANLLSYLVEYKLSQLQPWIARIRRTDFSQINVFLIASCPGGFHPGPNGIPWGHGRLGSILNKHSALINENCPVVAQSSSIGSLGPNVVSWIQNDFINSTRKDSGPVGIRRLPQFKMIYPSFNNVKGSHDDLLGGGCLPYGKQTNDKQPWLKDYLYQWKSKARYRSQAMPHIKTYARYSNEGLYWFVLTSANLSKAAWGSFNKSSKLVPCLRINNFEAGVVFLPRIMTGEDTFPLKTSRNDIPPFPMPYDLPLTPYGIDDKPFLSDYLRGLI